MKHLTPGDNVRGLEFCIRMLEALQDDDFADKLIFSNEATFKVNVICAISKTKDSMDFVYQQDWALPHWSLDVRAYLNDELLHHWIGRVGDDNDDLAFLPWPPRSLDLMLYDFFLWGHIKDINVPLLPKTIEERRNGSVMH